MFDRKDDARIRNTTSYEHTFFIVKHFYERYKEKILESRRNGNIDVIWEEVGKENFYKLNELFEIFDEHFSGMRVYALYDDLNNERDTELTRIYNEIIVKRNEILVKMNNYKKESEDKKTL